LEWETDGMLLAFGAMVGSCLRVAERLHDRFGLRVGVVNARFIKPLDRVTITKAIEECGFILTVEEGALMGGFGSAVLEAANEAGLPTTHIRRIGIPDRYILHAERDEQLAEVGLDVEGIAQAALALARATGWTPPERETDTKAKTAINSAAAAERGILTG
jgi:1-deoxy-D-xylulose-5-phosphate synthase